MLNFIDKHFFSLIILTIIVLIIGYGISWQYTANIFDNTCMQKGGRVIIDGTNEQICIDRSVIIKV
jgi:hypothetical protein